MQNDSALWTRIHNLSDEELVEIIKKASEYQPEIISYAQEELSRRGGQDTITARVTISQQHEDEKRREEYATKPLFLYIPIGRLIVMSIITFGFYEIYWMYKNWNYMEERDNLDIRPFVRALLSIFYCHSLLRHIHEYKEARSIQIPSFSPGMLSGGWVGLMILSSMVGRAPGIAASIISAFIPSFLFLVPVQSYINTVNERRIPGQPFYRWSFGHVLCLVVGIIFWALLLIELGAK